MLDFLLADYFLFFEDIPIAGGSTAGKAWLICFQRVLPSQSHKLRLLRIKQALLLLENAIYSVREAADTKCYHKQHTKDCAQEDCLCVRHVHVEERF